jgi:hypothetical protein
MKASWKREAAIRKQKQRRKTHTAKGYPRRVKEHTSGTPNENKR